MVTVTARTAACAGLQVEAQASLDSRKHEGGPMLSPAKVGRLAREGGRARALEPEFGSCEKSPRGLSM